MLLTSDPRFTDKRATADDANFASNEQPPDKPHATLQSKFLDSVRRTAEAEYLQLVIHYESPSEGYAYIQQKDSFVNLYAFHFAFRKASAEIYPDTDNVAAAPAERRRTVELSNGAKLEAVLNEILAGVSEASKTVHTQLKAFSEGSRLSALDKPRPGTGSSSTASGANNQFAGLIGRSTTSDRRDSAKVWVQDEAGVHAKEDVSVFRQESHRVRNGAIVLVVVFLCILFMPVMPVHSSLANCHGQACTRNPTYYASLANGYLGIGGVYLPSGQGWSQITFLGRVSFPTGGTAYGFGFWYYRFYV